MDGADQNAGHQTEFVPGKVCTNAHIFKGTAKNPKDKVFKATSSKATPDQIKNRLLLSTFWSNVCFVRFWLHLINQLFLFLSPQPS